uniref:Putative secreted protein n=1 Tax=Ixodes ricinus TaxID=34613 RepID=A0A6B0UV38_IXORI
MGLAITDLQFFFCFLLFCVLHFSITTAGEVIATQGSPLSFSPAYAFAEARQRPLQWLSISVTQEKVSNGGCYPARLQSVYTEKQAFFFLHLRLLFSFGPLNDRRLEKSNSKCIHRSPKLISYCSLKGAVQPTWVGMLLILHKLTDMR